MIHFIKCTDGKERQIFPAKVKHKDLIRHYTARFNSSVAIANIMAVDNEKITASDDANAEMLFDDRKAAAATDLNPRVAFDELVSGKRQMPSAA